VAAPGTHFNSFTTATDKVTQMNKTMGQYLLVTLTERITFDQYGSLMGTDRGNRMPKILTLGMNLCHRPDPLGGEAVGDYPKDR